MNKVALIITLILVVVVGLSACAKLTPVSTRTSPPPPSIDDIFLSRWGHAYYNNAPRASYHSLDIQKILTQISVQIPWQLCYEAGVFDCSEMTAYLEYVLERHGYTAEIAVGEVMGVTGHAWVFAYNDVADCWVPIEATSPTGTLDAILFHLLTGGMVIDYLNPDWRYATIHAVPHWRFEEIDWWNSPLADQLVAASDRAKLSAPLPPLPKIEPPKLPPLPKIEPPKLPPLPDLKEEED